MRISQLSERAGLPVGTVKFYLRSGLLQPGRALSATKAEYDETHLDRLRLIRALLEVGRLSHAEIQRVLAAMETAPDNITRALREVHAISPSSQVVDSQEVDTDEAIALVARLGWHVAPESPHLVALARALSALDSLGLAPDEERLRAYAEAADGLARDEVDAVFRADDDRKVVIAAANAVLYEALLGALRRLSTESHAASLRGPVPAPRSGRNSTAVTRRSGRTEEPAVGEGAVAGGSPADSLVAHEN